MAGGFSAQIRAWRKQTEAKLETVGSQTVQETFAVLKRHTPVDTEALRNSWTQSADRLPVTFNGAVLAAVPLGKSVFIATDKPYAPVIEYGLYPNPPKHPTGRTQNGYSTQAPAGMVRITVKEMRRWIERQIWT